VNFPELAKWLEPWASKIRTVIDVGCADGYWAEDIRKVCPLAHVHGIDARPSSRAKGLVRQGWFTHYPGTLLGDGLTEEAEFHVLNRRTASSLLPPAHNIPDYWRAALREREVRTLPLVTLDSLRAEKQPMTLIKLDVQGAELEVLHGAKQTLKHSDLLITELTLADSYKGQTTMAGLSEFLEVNRFRYLGNPRQALKKGVCAVIDTLWIKEDFV